MTQVFTKSCLRDTERLAVCAATVKRFLPEAQHDIVTEDRVSYAVLPPYLQQQLIKLERAAQSEGSVFHLDADMWVDERAASAIRSSRNVWVYRPLRDIKDRVFASAVTKWQDVVNATLEIDVPPVSYMMEQRGWWLRGHIVRALEAHLWKLGSTFFQTIRDAHLRRARFSEYQLYATFARHFFPREHEWVHADDVVSPTTRAVGQDKLLFARHFSSADEPPHALRRHWSMLLDGSIS